MTREEARREIDSLDFYLQNHTDDYGEESHTAMMMAIKALRQTNKIKALGDELRIYQKAITNEVALIGFNMAVAICNKHLAESEESNE